MAPSLGEAPSAAGARNDLLNAPDADTFVSLLLGSLGSYPPYFHRLGEVNRRGPAPVRRAGAAPILSPAEVSRAKAGGAEVLDVRAVRDFAAGHIPGSLSLPLRPAFATWLGWLVDLDRDVVIVRTADQDFDEVWWQAAKIGQDHLVGQVADGLEEWRALGHPTTSIGLVDARGVKDRAVLDIREPAEYETGHIPGARNVALGSLRTDVDAVPAQPTVVMCGHGERAMGAASLLARAGRSDLVVLEGGPGDWADATGRDLETGE